MTRLVLDPPRQIGQVWISAIAEVALGAKVKATTLIAHGRKEPRFLLVGRADAVSCFDNSGDPVPEDFVENACPGPLAAFRKAIAPEPPR